jgi:hypothetical protein
MQGVTERGGGGGANFGQEFYIPKQEKMSTSAWVQRHLMCEIQLKEHIYNECSKCYA